MNVEAQIADLTRRVTALEADSQGQQRYNARLLEMAIELRDDVSVLRRHSVALGQRFDALETRFNSLEARVTAEIAGLRRDLPGMIAETMREVLREAK